MAQSWLVFVPSLLFGAIRFNEAVVLQAHKTHSRTAATMHNRRFTEEEVKANMTIDKAYRFFLQVAKRNKVERGKLGLVDATIGATKNLRVATAPATNDKVKDTDGLVRKMLEDLVLEKDDGERECELKHQTDQSQLISYAQTITGANKKAADHQGMVLDNRKNIEQITDIDLPSQREEQIKKHSECKHSLALMRHEEKTLANDSVVLGSVLSEINCDSSNSSSMLQMYRAGNTNMKCLTCSKGKSKYTWLQTEGMDAALRTLKSQKSVNTVIAKLGHDPFKQVSTLQTPSNQVDDCPFTEQLVGEKGVGYRGCQYVTYSGKLCQSWTNPTVHNHTLMTTIPNASVNFGLGDHNYCRNPNKKDSIWCYTMSEEVTWEYCAPLLSDDVSQPQIRECIATNGCELSADNCDEMFDKFSEIQSEVSDQSKDKQDEIAKEENRCETTLKQIGEQIEELNSNLADFQAQFATNQGSAVAAQRLSYETSQLHAELDAEFHESQTQCCKECNDRTSEICALKKIRDKMRNMSAFRTGEVRDCKVSPWVKGDCSAECEGGIRNSVREILEPPANGGAACGPLMEHEDCNMQKCPIDCIEGEWSEWNQCTAGCGGGLQSRNRQVHRKSEYGGTPCGELTATQTCGSNACDKDCVLDEWEPDGSLCTKACNYDKQGAGHQVEIKKVLEEATGLGTCDSPESSARRRAKLRCNDFACEIPPNRVYLECSGALDIAIMLDGSGSLRQSGWDASKNGAQQLLRAFRHGPQNVHVSMTVFSGPRYWSEVVPCQSGVKPYEQCGIKTVSNFTDNIDSVIANLRSTDWPSGSTFTGLALSVSDHLLQHSWRPHALKEVVVITDGRPFSYRTTKYEAEAILKEGERLTWIANGAIAGNQNDLQELAGMASEPARDNVYAFDFEEWNLPHRINTILAGICPSVSVD